MKIDNRLQDLERRHPEWAPWLAVIGEMLNEVEDPGWDAAVQPGAMPQQRGIPLLAKGKLELDERVVRRVFENLLRSARHGGAPKLAGLQAVAYAKVDVLRLFREVLNQDSDGLNECAAAVGADPEAFRAVATLVPMPFLHACNRRWASSLSGSWLEGYCPVCGAWPSFAEVRGIERARYLRCGRCGAEWQGRYLFCPYCGTTDHEALATLVPEKGGPKSAIEVCNRCLGYVKAFTKLQGSPPAMVILDDLASVALDVAAAARGYRRPPGAGCALDLTLADNAAAFFA